MQQDVIELYKKFQSIKDRKWVKNIGIGTGSMGTTFEYLIGREENSLEIPDFGEIEIKTKHFNSKSYISLFHMTPCGRYYHEVERLKDIYGYPDRTLPQYKVLNNSVFCTCRTNIGKRYQFMLKVEKKEERIYLCIFDKLGILIEKDVYWDFDTIKEKLYRKLKMLALIKGRTKKINGERFYHFFDMKLYCLKDFSTFISLIEKGVIRINFSIGVFKHGKRRGQIHDHGTSFDIQECDLLKLYNPYNFNEVNIS